MRLSCCGRVRPPEGCGGEFVSLGADLGEESDHARSTQLCILVDDVEVGRNCRMRGCRMNMERAEMRSYCELLLDPDVFEVLAPQSHHAALSDVQGKLVESSRR